MYIHIVIAAFLIMLASLAGKLFTWKALGKFVMPRIRYLVALAAGVFVVIIVGLIGEATHDGITRTVGIAFMIGALLLALVTKLLPDDTHHHHGPEEDHTHRPLDARRMLIGDAIHNIHDGLALVPAFLVSPIVGFGTAAGIFLHELVQEVSEFFVLKEAGYSDRKALAWNFAVSSTILIGVIIASILVSIEGFAHPLVAFSAGGLSYVLVRDLIPSVMRHARRERRYGSYAFMFVLGLALMTTIQLTVPHEYEDVYPLPQGFELV